MEDLHLTADPEEVEEDELAVGVHNLELVDSEAESGECSPAEEEDFGLSGEEDEDQGAIMPYRFEPLPDPEVPGAAADDDDDDNNNRAARVGNIDW